MNNTEQARTINYYESSDIKRQSVGGTSSPVKRDSTISQGNSSGKKPKNAKEHYGNVDLTYEELHNDSIEMKRNIELIKFELNRVNANTEKTLDEFTNMIVAGVDSKLKELEKEIEEQKEENLKMQNQITEMRKEGSHIQQRILIGNKKAQHIKESVGTYEQD